MVFRSIAIATAVFVLLAHDVLIAIAQVRTIIVFAAASLKNALDDANAQFTNETGVKVVASYAGTSALVRQIEQAAPADVFASADARWMDHAIRAKLIKPETRTDLLGNRLVLIAPANASLGEVDLKRGVDLLALLGDGRLVTADVKAVPAGRYAKAALEHLGHWSAIEPRLAMTENVRVALALVARGEAPLGIVYETDAKVEPQVKIVGVFPQAAHPPVIYAVAETINAKPEAGRYLAFLRSPAAGAVFSRHGFTFLAAPAPQ